MVHRPITLEDVDQGAAQVNGHSGNLEKNDKILVTHAKDTVSQAVHTVIGKKAPVSYADERKAVEMEQMEKIRNAPIFDKALPVGDQLLQWKNHTYIKILFEDAFKNIGPQPYLLMYSTSEAGDFVDSPIGTKHKHIVDISNTEWSTISIYYSTELAKEIIL